MDDLEEAQMVIDGNIPSNKLTGQISEADLIFSGNPASGVSGGDFAAPGDPKGALVTVATGKVKVSTAGIVSVGMGADDGGYLHIDLDGNGIFASGQVVALDGNGAFRYGTADVDFPDGTFDFEWLAYNARGAFGSELITSLPRVEEPPQQSMIGNGNLLSRSVRRSLWLEVLALPPIL